MHVLLLLFLFKLSACCRYSEQLVTSKAQYLSIISQFLVCFNKKNVTFLLSRVNYNPVVSRLTGQNHSIYKGLCTDKIKQ